MITFLLIISYCMRLISGCTAKETRDIISLIISPLSATGLNYPNRGSGKIFLEAISAEHLPLHCRPSNRR